MHLKHVIPGPKNKREKRKKFEIWQGRNQDPSGGLCVKVTPQRQVLC